VVVFVVGGKWWCSTQLCVAVQVSSDLAYSLLVSNVNLIVLIIASRVNFYAVSAYIVSLHPKA
jgi:hypothetical protein